MSKKTNHPEASLRANKPKAEKVRQAEVKSGAAVAAAKKQNVSGGKDGGPAVLPNTGPLAPPKA